MIWQSVGQLIQAMGTDIGTFKGLIGVLNSGLDLLATGFTFTAKQIRLEGEAVSRQIRGDFAGAAIAEKEKAAQFAENLDPVFGKLIAAIDRMEAARIAATQQKQTALQERAQELAPYSPEISRALAMAEAQRIQGNIQAARALGPSLGGFVESRTQIENLAKQLSTPATRAEAETITQRQRDLGTAPNLKALKARGDLQGYGSGEDLSFYFDKIPDVDQVIDRFGERVGQEVLKGYQEIFDKTRNNQAIVDPVEKLFNNLGKDRPMAKKAVEPRLPKGPGMPIFGGG